MTLEWKIVRKKMKLICIQVIFHPENSSMFYSRLHRSKDTPKRTIKKLKTWQMQT